MTLDLGEGARFVLFLLVLVAASAVAVAAGVAGPTASSAPGSPPADGADVRVTEDGTRYLVHPGALRQGCPGTDCIPSIEDPTFQPADAADWLDGDDRVIGVVIDGEARAYPLRILAAHEIVNDQVAGRPVAVTYCPLCRSGLVFDRRVEGTTLSFGVSGKLLDANLVMYDRETKTYWSQLNGTAIVGPQVPRQLEILPNTLTTWSAWRASHPESVVLSRNTGIFHESTYSSTPYADYGDNPRVGFGVEHVDDRLGAKTIVYGVRVNDTAKAYEADAIAEAGIINDEVGGVPVLLVENRTSGGVSVFVRRVEGRARTFRVVDGELVDDEGTRWSGEGRALDGPLAGTRLERLPSHGIYWFAWSQFHPETGLYRP